MKHQTNKFYKFTSFLNLFFSEFSRIFFSINRWPLKNGIMAQDPQGLYEVLGLKAGASIDEVKKAFTKKQRECHPDGAFFKAALRKCKTDEERAKVEKEFKEKSQKCNQAKAVLFDEKKKQEYDMGMTGDFGFSAGGGDFFDIFSSFTGGGRRNRVQKVQDTEYEFNISLKEAYMGKRASFNVKVQRECSACNGKGGDSVETCEPCKGKGKVEHHRRLGPLISVQEAPCNNCNSTGFVVKGKLCQSCKGKQYVETKEHIEVEVEPGVQNGRKYTFSGKGNHKKNCVPGDVILIVNITNDPRFRKSGYNLISKVDIPLYVALAGGQIIFEHITGKKFEITLYPFKDLKKCIILKGEGFKIKNSYSGGDLILEPNIIIDKNIDKDLLARALNYVPVRKDFTGTAVPKYAEFGVMPKEQEEQNERERFEGAEEFFGGNGRDFFSKFGFF